MTHINFKKAILKPLQILLLLSIILTSCNGQKKSNPSKETEKTLTTLAVTPLKVDIPRVDSILRFTENIRSIFEDSNGNFWFGTQSEGVCRYNGKVFTYFTINEGLCNNQVQTIQEDEKGRIWFGTGGGICFLDEKTIYTLPVAENVTNTGLWENKQTWETQRPDNRNGLNQNWKKDSSDLWFYGGSNNGTYQYNGEDFDYFAFPIPKEDSTYNHDFRQYSIYSIYKNKDGDVWFGTQSKGVVRFDGKDFLYINEKKMDTVVRAIFEDKDGIMWFGSNGGGVFRYDGMRVTNLTLEHGLENPAFMNGDFRDKPGTLARIWAIEQDNNGDMWFGTIDAGAWRYDGKTLTNYTEKDGLSDKTIHTIYKDRKGKLWFATNYGVFTFNGNTFDIFGN